MQPPPLKTIWKLDVLHQGPFQGLGRQEPLSIICLLNITWLLSTGLSAFALPEPTAPLLTKASTLETFSHVIPVAGRPWGSTPWVHG